MNVTVSSAWLIENMSEDLSIIDCRFSLQEPKQGRKLYEESHIPGAVYFDLNEDLSGEVKEHGGRHPLPAEKDFIEKLESAGISNSSAVVVYDGGEAAFASRFWWLLNYYGHDKVFILNGGFKEWTAQGFPVEKEVKTKQRGNFKAQTRPEMKADIDEIKQIINGKTASLLIDSRSYDRYIGQHEPIDRVAGHIPGAIHRDWMDGVSKGFFLKDEEQANRFSEWEKDRPIVVYCGSGVTATPNIIALKQAGFKNVKLYPGSYSDWVSYDENEIELGDSTHFEK
ncbi:sulfurtransferase [Jeotgalibacillus proteolyticus]|uniref:Sulfurtransferase n=1 Tax=Jeotgalibacillus proteolyticus TaxID=2082395 RepID=A0A2S5GE37_9BACL|nr:sulfurtransferase [Jeotgalibacillus proteolyticus]PPA71218.1 sulfurtransferase [Jeotgalibacillus proteolyticus]